MTHGAAGAQLPSAPSKPEACSFVDGALSKSDSAAAIDVIDPSTGRPCCTIPRGSDGDIDRAVKSARRAFADGRWSEASLSVRRDALGRLAGLIEAESKSLDLLDAAEMGKPVSLAFGSAAAAAGLMRFYAEAVDKVTGDVYAGDRQTLVMQRLVPRGVVAAIVPWNFPTYNTVLKVAPALAAGNCTVLKPSELSSRSAVRIAELALQAGIPPGVLNVVLGLGETAGHAAAVHADVDMVAFTGSTQVGKRMLQYAGQSNMKVVLTECGGKSPHIVFDDGVSLDAVADSIAGSLLINQGQLCSVGSRLIVQRSIEAALVDKIATRLARLVAGNAIDERTTFGPLASSKQCARVAEYVGTALLEGAQLVAGGRRMCEESGGFFFEPTMLRVAAQSTRIVQEEIFGPVLTVTPFDRESEAIEMANGTVYGLAAYVWTAMLSTGLRMAKSMRSTVFINAAAPSGEGPGHMCSAEPSGQSGLGVEGGLAGMESYQRRQLVWFNHA